MRIPAINIKDTVTFSLEGLMPGTHTVKVVAISTTGVSASDTKTFEICRSSKHDESIPIYAVSFATEIYFAGEYKGKV